MANSAEIAVTLTAIDRMTAVIRQACVNAEAKFGALAKKTDKISESAAKVGKTTAIMGAALAAPLILATKAAIEFESSMADVAKVANLDKSSKQFKALSENAIDLSKYLAQNANDVGKLYSNLLAGGTAQSELGKVAKIAGEAAVAFDITQEAAGEAFAVMKNAMNLSVDETKKAFDATNAITNKFGGKASDILEFMSSGGASVARTFKATAPEMEAFGRAIMKSGVSASEAGTVMQRFRVGLYKNAEAMKIFTGAGGGASGMQAVFEAAARSGDPFKWFQKHKFGEYSSQMSLLAGNGKQLNEMLKFMRVSTNYTNSATQEFNSRMDTTEMRLKKARAAFEGASIKAGQAFLPVVIKLAEKVTPMIEKISKWIQRNPELTATIVKIVAAGSVMLFTISAISYAISGFTKAISWGSTAISFLSKAMKMSTYTTAYWNVTTKASTAATYIWSAAQRAAAAAAAFMGNALKAVNMLFVSSPIGWIALGIGLAATLIIKYWDKIKQFFINLWAYVKEAFNKAWEMFKKYGLYLIGPVGVVIKHWDQIKTFFTQLFPKIKEKFNAFIDFVKSIPARMFEAGKNIVKSIWEGIKMMASKPVEAIKMIVQKIRNFLPFSPAKEGPFRDIHRVRIVETIAESMKPGPMVKAMRLTTAAAMLAVKPVGVNAMNPTSTRGGGTTINYSPQITLNGGSPSVKEDLKKILNDHSKEIYRLVKQEEKKQERTKF